MQDKPRSLRHRRIRLYYAGIVFGVMTLSLATAGCVAAVLYLTGVWPSIALFAFLTLGGASLVIGTVISGIISRRVLKPMLRLSEASRRVAQGDFSVRLGYSGHLDEVQATYRSFNDMVSELGATETLRDDFVANVSHEFKTPINAIEGYATLLQDPQLGEDERREYIDQILVSTGRLSALVSNILLLSKLDNGAYPDEAAAFSLDEQIRQALLLLEPRWAPKGLRLDVELDSVRYTGCESMLMQVWINLVDNAIKFSPPGGTVHVRLRALAGGAEVVVSDEGEGMSQETQRHVFDKFYQGDTSHRAEGNGLGLSLVRAIVLRHSGEVTVKSAPGAGATFTVLLPAQAS